LSIGAPERLSAHEVRFALSAKDTGKVLGTIQVAGEGDRPVTVTAEGVTEPGFTEPEAEPPIEAEPEEILEPEVEAGPAGPEPDEFGPAVPSAFIPDMP